VDSLQEENVVKEKKLVEFLMNPGAYPENPVNVELVQTHISWVFIGDDFVYKVKKPVDFGFLDFSTLDKRRFFTHEELRLNKRFSPDVYLEVVPISQVDQTYRIGDSSNIVEYALKMKRINEDKMLNNLLKEGKIRAEDMARVGKHLAGVYQKIESDEKSRSFGTLEVISTNVIENFDQTRKYIGGPISDHKFNTIERWSRNFMDTNKVLFNARIDQGHIKDSHGDLHLQHICIEDAGIFVFDCIEFNERFRFGDVASDVAFLSMDFDYNGEKALGDAFVDAYINTSGDSGMKDVLVFYKVYRAYVRAKVTSFMLDDAGLDESRRKDAFATAQKYYDLAYDYVSNED
jgi:aminoglycoside phosphotransferase family enzyme